MRAELSLGAALAHELSQFSHFHGFVQKQLGFEAASSGWALVTAEKYPDEETGFSTFLVLFDRFRELADEGS